MPFLATLGNIGKHLLGALPVVGSYLQSQQDQKYAKYNTDRTIQANKELAEYQYSKDLEMWEKGNQYNSPSAQMQRLKDAGLNPNFIYGSSGATQPAVNLPKYQAPNVEYNYKPGINLPQMLSMYQDMQIKNAQLDNLRVDRETKELNRDFLDSTLWSRTANVKDLHWMNRIRKDWMREHYDTMQGYSMDYRKKATEALDSQIRLRDKQIEWYASDRLANYLGIGGGMLRHLGSFGKSGAKGVKSDNPLLKGYNPQVNPRNQWKGKYGDWYGWGYGDK